MRIHRSGLPAIGIALATVALIGACAGPAAAPAPAPPATPPAPTATSAPATGSAPAADPSQAPTTAASTAPPTGPTEPTGPTDGVEPVNCGAVGPDGGAQVDLIADSTAAGRVGCTEAINVISVYYRDAAMAEGTGRHLEVQGWQCSADTGAYGSGTIGCSKNGFAFHTQP
jgi:hypothetical protein